MKYFFNRIVEKKILTKSLSRLFKANCRYRNFGKHQLLKSKGIYRANSLRLHFKCNFPPSLVLKEPGPDDLCGTFSINLFVIASTSVQCMYFYGLWERLGR